MSFFKALLFFSATFVLVAAAPGQKNKRSPQMPAPPGMPPMPMPPMPIDQFSAQTLTRFVRQAQDAPAPAPPSRVAREAQDAPAPPKRFVRQTLAEEAAKPKHIRQEAFYSSLTSMARKKRGSNSNAETEIRG